MPGGNLLLCDLLAAVAELEPYELNRTQTAPQQCDRRAPIRHTLSLCRQICGEAVEQTRRKRTGTGRALNGESPRCIGIFKAISAHDPRARNVEKLRRLLHDCGAEEIKREPAHAPQTRGHR